MKYTTSQKKAIVHFLTRMVNYATDHSLNCAARLNSEAPCAGVTCQTSGAELVDVVLENLRGLENDGAA